MVIADTMLYAPPGPCAWPRKRAGARWCLAPGRANPAALPLRTLRLGAVVALPLAPHARARLSLRGLPAATRPTIPDNGEAKYFYLNRCILNRLTCIPITG